MTLAPKGKGGCDSSIMPATGSRTLAQTAGGKRIVLVWDLVKDVESVIKKDGNKATLSPGRLPVHKTEVLRDPLHAFGDQLPGSQHASLRFGALIRSQPGMRVPDASCRSRFKFMRTMAE